MKPSLVTVGNKAIKTLGEYYSVKISMLDVKRPLAASTQ